MIHPHNFKRGVQAHKKRESIDCEEQKNDIATAKKECSTSKTNPKKTWDKL